MKNDFMIIISVKDLDASVDFYKNIIGFDLAKKIKPGPGINIAFMLFNNAIEIELLKRKDLPDVTNENSGITLSFKSNDVDAAYEMLLANNVKCEGKPFALPTGIKVVRFFDPNGVCISFMEE